MKRLRFLLLVAAICLASGVKAQFYDSANDIYYYVECKNGQLLEDGKVFIFNFDGRKAAVLGNTTVKGVKSVLSNNSSFYEDKVEVTEYDTKFTRKTSAGTEYITASEHDTSTGLNGNIFFITTYYNLVFSSDRQNLSATFRYEGTDGVSPGGYKTVTNYKRVDKSFFRVGRRR